MSKDLPQAAIEALTAWKALGQQDAEINALNAAIIAEEKKADAPAPS